MSEWKETTLSNLIKIGNGKSRPKENGDIPIYGGNGILGFTNQSNYNNEIVIIGRVYRPLNSWTDSITNLRHFI